MDSMNAPATLNGYPVIHHHSHANCATVLVDRGEEERGPRFVVATWWPELKTSWSWGHYVDEAGKNRTMVEVRSRNMMR